VKLSFKDPYACAGCWYYQGSSSKIRQLFNLR